MGNRLGTDDGWAYRGRGGSQLTGRDSYGKVGAKLGLDLVNTPDLVNHPANFLDCAVADFVLCGCLPFAIADDLSGVTYHLNGGYIGVSQRAIWLTRWKAALRPDLAAGSTVWVQQSLNRLGNEPPLIADGPYGPLTMAAVRAFQTDNDLAVDGRVGPETVAAISDALAALPG